MVSGERGNSHGCTCVCGVLKSLVTLENRGGPNIILAPPPAMVWSASKQSLLIVHFSSLIHEMDPNG